MTTPLDHPWLSRPSVGDRIGGFDSAHRDAIRVEMKSAVAMLEATNQPEWVIVIDECYHWVWTPKSTARTRIVVDQHATIDIEGDKLAAPITTLLSDSQLIELRSVLNDLTPKSLADSTENTGMEGSKIAIMVANGPSSWCHFFEFTLGNFLYTDVWGLGNRLHEIVYSFRHALEDAHNHARNVRSNEKHE